MTPQQRVDLAIDYGMRLIGTPYIYGGNNPMTGLDCSGLVLVMLRGVGLWGPSDARAQGIYEEFRRKIPATAKPRQKGMLLFFGHTRASIDHVAIAVSDEIMLEAGGGDPQTLTVEDAKKKGAFVRLATIDRRTDLLDSIFPW